MIDTADFQIWSILRTGHSGVQPRPNFSNPLSDILDPPLIQWCNPFIIKTEIVIQKTTTRDYKCEAWL